MSAAPDWGGQKYASARLLTRGLAVEWAADAVTERGEGGAAGGPSVRDALIQMRDNLKRAADEDRKRLEGYFGNNGALTCEEGHTVPTTSR